MIVRLVVLDGLAVAGVAHAESKPPAAAPSVAPGATRAAPVPPADDPDPAVEYAADANLESTENRQGLTFAGLSIYPRWPQQQENRPGDS